MKETDEVIVIGQLNAGGVVKTPVRLQPDHPSQGEQETSFPLRMTSKPPLRMP
jgi:hypothetical protein